jgi:B12-binding domain/radical SAM domain protein
MNYDVVLIHPPANYDFRKKTLFPGPIAYTVGESKEQFMIPSVGILSIAEYLDRNGYKVIVDNLCERMVKDKDLDVEEHIKNLQARVYAIGLHWCVHSQGAIEIADMCKQLHPDSIVVMGGLTSTVFAEEIVSKCSYIDAVVRGEAEKPFLALMKALDGDKQLAEVPNLTLRNDEGRVISNPLMPPSDNLDEYDFTRLDLLEPREVIFRKDMPAHWMIPVCRGCTHNCATCGGSAYSYKKYLGRCKPAFRSPHRIAQDINRLGEQGVELIFLFQDPRMGGRQYWSELFTTLRDEIKQKVRLSMEIFGPADEEYIKAISEIGVPVTLTVSPESGVDSIRKAHGRNYTMDGIFKTAGLCKKYNIMIGIHMMIALGNDTRETIKQTWKTWEQICQVDRNSPGESPVLHAFGPMILLDPGSPAFDSPGNHGFQLIFKNFEDYFKGLYKPVWTQWISYETKHLNRKAIVELILDSLEYSIKLRLKYGLFSKEEADEALYGMVTINKIMIDGLEMLEKGNVPN